MTARPLLGAAPERARLAALERYQVMDTEPEVNFDELTALAAYVCGTPMALVSLVDAERQWFKARLGVELCETGRDIAFCPYALHSAQPFVVPDAMLDPRFADNPLVLGDPFIRFYAGAPLVTPDGYVLGTLCVLDTVPRVLTDEQLGLLTSLARQTMTQLENRRQADELAAQNAAVKASAAFHDAVLAASPDLIFLVDPSSNMTLWSSRNLVEMLGYTEQDLHDFGDAIVTTLVHRDDVVRLRAANQAARDLDDGAVLQIRYRALHASGDYRWLSRRVTPFARDDDGLVIEILGVARDVTELVEVEERLREAALQDALTGLPNRTLMDDRLCSALARSTRSGQDLAVLFVDLDGFKQVNDSGGHPAGDEVLRVTADRLRACLRAVDSVARVGGDEFVVLVEAAAQRPGDRSPGDVRRDAMAVAERIKETLAEPIVFAGATYRVTASVGVTFAHQGNDPHALVRDADTAMYLAKSRGKNRCEVFESV